MRPCKVCWILLTGFFLLEKLEVMASREKDTCDKDKECKTHEVCCDTRCKSWPMCFVNSDKDCYYDTHCVKGRNCVNNKCVRKKVESGASCDNNRDCTIDVKVADDSLAGRKLCCFGKCLPAANCTVHLYINTSRKNSKNASPSIRNSCVDTVDCPTGFVCLNAKCSRQENRVVSRRKTITNGGDDDSNDTKENKMSTGLLSAALFSAAVLIMFACFCFIRETKYYRRICYDQNQERHLQPRSQRGNNSTESTATNHSTFHLSNSQYPVSRIIFPLFSEHRFHVSDRNVVDREQGAHPPTYRSISRCNLDLPPPTYDEAVKASNKPGS